MTSSPTTSTIHTPGAISPTWTVNDTILRVPNAVHVFNAFGVDACCGGAATLEQAAADARISVATLVDALELASVGAR